MLFGIVPLEISILLLSHPLELLAPDFLRISHPISLRCDHLDVFLIIAQTSEARPSYSVRQNIDITPALCCLQRRLVLILSAPAKAGREEYPGVVHRGTSRGISHAPY